MKIRPDDNSLIRFWVTSESDSDVEYLVDLSKFHVGKNDHGDDVFNGACCCTRSPDSVEEFGCRDFVFRCEPKLKRATGIGHTYRCKHIILVRDFVKEYATDALISRLVRIEPNMPDEFQT